MPPPIPSSRMSTCLWLPTFELRLELVRTPELDATSVALLSPGESGGQRDVWQVSERGARLGVRPGMRVSRAVSLCPALTLLEPDPAHYDVVTGEILEVLEGVSPVVRPTTPGTFHVGVDGLERLYGPPRAQVERILHTLLEVLPRPLVAAIRAGRGPGLFGASMAAASARPGSPVLVEAEELPGFLAPHSISALPLSTEALERLKRLEITTLGDLGKLPLPALVRHFGAPGREARALARGERIDPVLPLHRPRPIRVALNFPSPVGERGTLHRALDRLLQRGLDRVERRERSVRGVRMGGHLEEGGSWQVEATLREPSARREDLAYPLRGRIVLSPPPRALESLFVEFFDFGAPAFQRSLFRERSTEGEDRISRNLREAVRELTLKLGHSPLYRVVEVDPWSRIPERRHALMALEPRDPVR